MSLPGGESTRGEGIRGRRSFRRGAPLSPLSLLLLLSLLRAALPLPRVSVGAGGAFLAGGAPFQPRGLNFVRLNGTQFAPPETLPVYHCTFSPLFFNATAAAIAADGAAAAGLNFVRVFIDAGTPQRADGVNGPWAAEQSLSSEYLANVATFVALFAARGIYTMPTLDGLPANAYWSSRAGPAPAWCEYPQCELMAPGFVAGFAAFAASFVAALEADHGLDSSALLGLALANEAFLLTSTLPFSAVTGVVHTADGGAYDMGNATSRQACADGNAVSWAAAAAAAVRAASPQVLVAVGLFTPQAVCKPGFIGVLPVAGCGDDRYPLRPRALAQAAPAAVDFIDLHVYPLGHVVASVSSPDWSLDADLATAEWSEVNRTRAPVLMAETGAFKDFFASATDAAAELAELVHLACLRGFKGAGVWTWDTVEQSARIWTMLDGGGAIRDALAPRRWPDVCDPPPPELPPGRRQPRRVARPRRAARPRFAARPLLAPSPAPSAVFSAGQGGFGSFCAPALGSNSNAVVVAAEAHAAASGACGGAGGAGLAAALVSRLSTDAGQSWAPLVTVASAPAGCAAAGCGFAGPTAVTIRLDAATDILLLAAVAADARALAAGDLDVLLWRSRDGGASFGEQPANLSAALGGRPLPRPAGGHGLALMQGPHAGRLVVPAVADFGPGGTRAAALLSDDGGATWRRGAADIAPARHAAFAEMLWQTTGAAGAAQAAVPPPGGDGDIFAFVEDDVTPCGSSQSDRCRWASYSVDGGNTWGAPTPVSPLMADAGVRGSAAVWWGGRGWLLVNARGAGLGDGLGGNLTLFASQDGGEGGTGEESVAPVAGAADVATAIWLQIVEWGVLAFESAKGGIEVIFLDPSTLI